MSNRGFLLIIAVLLLGIFSILAIQANEKQRSPGEKIADRVNEAVEEVGDEIDDHTDAR